jgi:hypothetical protein
MGKSGSRDRIESHPSREESGRGMYNADETANPKALSKILNNSKEKCPIGAEGICKALNNRAIEALRTEAFERGGT